MIYPRMDKSAVFLSLAMTIYTPSGAENESEFTQTQGQYLHEIRDRRPRHDALISTDTNTDQWRNATAVMDKQVTRSDRCHTGNCEGTVTG